MPMEPKAFTLSNLHEVDRGKAFMVFNHLLKMLVTDIVERPNDGAARTLTFKVKKKPNIDADTGALDDIRISFDVNPTMPKRVTAEYSMLPANDGSLLFQPDSPFDARQGSFDFDPATGEVRDDDDMSIESRDDDEDQPESRI